MVGFLTPPRLFLGIALAAAVAGAVAAESGPTVPVAATTRLLTPSPPPAAAAAEVAEPVAGDAHLKGLIALSQARLRNGRYEVVLDDGRVAVLTLDPTLQATAEKVIARAKAPMAAIVVMATNGDILAIAGAKDQGKQPDFSLPVTVWAPAASIFKIVTATALVDAGVGPKQQVCYHGGLRSIERSNLVDNAKRDRRCGDLGYAIARSQNALIAKLAHKHLSPADLRSFADELGFNAAPDFALEVEANHADIPDKPLEFARVSAGFWHTELSPLGGALLANAVAAGGVAVTPRIVAAMVDEAGTTRSLTQASAPRVFSAAVAAKVARMMAATTETGTARKGFHDRRGRKFMPEISIAGKTGTLTRRQPSYLQYSWFVGFAPVDAPAVTISVLLGNPERWHLKAHTAARIVLQEAIRSRTAAAK